MLILALSATLFTATAQEPWRSLDSKQKRTILTARKTPEVLREAMRHVDSIKGEERDKVWELVSRPAKDKKAVPLYLYLYDILRPTDGTAGESDFTMIKTYPDYVLTNFWGAGRDGDIYNYAYAVARYGVTADEQSKVMGTVEKLAKEYSAKQNNTYASFASAVALADASLTLGKEFVIDPTYPEIMYRIPREISLEEFDAEKLSLKPFEAKSAVDTIAVARDVAKQCMMWSGYYHRTVDHKLGRKVRVVMSETPSARYITIEDADGRRMLLPERIYFLPEGGFFALAVDDEGRADYIVTGYIIDGVFQKVTTVALESGFVRSIKCNKDGALFFKLRSGSEDKCFRMNIGEYDRR